MTRIRGLALVLAGAVVGAAATAHPQEADRLKTAKTLYFDRKYVEARAAWQKVAAGGGSDGVTASYWVAQCSEKLGEDERALSEYAEYLAKRPAGQLAEEARTSRVKIATRLYKAGRAQHLPILETGLADTNRTVRYFSALQLCSLGPGVGRPAVDVLQTMVENETDTDLLERAKLCLVKLGAAQKADALAPSAGQPIRWLRVRIHKSGSAKEPDVTINMPVGLADLVLKSLPEDARAELGKKGIDAEDFWRKLKISGPSEIVDITGSDGERIRIWIE